MVELTIEPPVALIVNVLLPDATFLFVLTVRTEFPEPTIEGGVNLAFANLGRPLAANEIGPV